MVRFHPRLPLLVDRHSLLVSSPNVPSHRHASRRVDENRSRSATTVGEIAAGISPRLAQAAYAGMVNDRVVDLTYPLAGRREGSHPHVEGSGSADGLSPQHGAPAGGRRDAALPEGAVRHRAADRRRVLLRLRRREAVRAGGSRGHRKEECASSPAAICVFERQMWPREEAIDFFTRRGEPLKVQLIEEKTAGQNDVSCYTIKDRDTFVDFCVGPHVPSSGQAEGLQAADHVERVLEGRRAQSADAAHLRHGVLQRERAEGVPDAHRRSEEARPSQARARAGPLPVPSVGGRRDVLAREGHDALEPARRTTCATCCSPPATPK